jgi:hypothetical protein
MNIWSRLLKIKKHEQYAADIVNAMSEFQLTASLLP